MIRSTSNCICNQTEYSLDDRCICDGVSYNCHSCYTNNDSCICYTNNYASDRCSCYEKLYNGNCSKYNINANTYKRIGVVTVSKLSIRSYANTSSSVVGTLLSGKLIEIIAETRAGGYLWYHIKDDEGVRPLGWVLSNYITVEKIMYKQGYADPAGEAYTPPLIEYIDSNKYDIPELEFYGTRNSVSYLDIINLMEEVDLHVAKFEKTSSDGYWCFHGHEDMGWSSSYKVLQNRRYIFKTSIAKILNWSKSKALTNRHLTMRFEPYDKVSSVEYGMLIRFFVVQDGTTRVISQTKNIGTSTRNQTIYMNTYDLLNKEDFDTLKAIYIYPITFSIGSDIYSHNDKRISMEYIKLDNANRQYFPYFESLIDEQEGEEGEDYSNLRTHKSISDKEIDIIREETINAKRLDINFIDPGKTKKDMARAFIDTIKKKSLEEVNTHLKESDNCLRCDSNTCSCFQKAFGYVSCKTCDGCNSYQACSCDEKCYSETLNCTCDNKGYGYVHTCSCNGRCYGYNSCSCNGRCFNEGTTCSCDYRTHMTCTCYNKSHGYTYIGCSCDYRCHGYKKCSCDGDWR